MTADDVTLTEAEREALHGWLRTEGQTTWLEAESVYASVERILADRLAAVQAEREVLAGQYEAEVEELEADVIAEETRANENATLVHAERARAESAERRLAERDQQLVDAARELGIERARLAEVEALVSDAEAWRESATVVHGIGAAALVRADRLRAALANPPAEDESVDRSGPYRVDRPQNLGTYARAAAIDKHDAEVGARAWDEGHAMAHGYDLSYELDRGEWEEEHGEMAKLKNPYREAE